MWKLWVWPGATFIHSLIQSTNIICALISFVLNPRNFRFGDDVDLKGIKIRSQRSHSASTIAEISPRVEQSGGREHARSSLIG